MARRNRFSKEFRKNVTQEVRNEMTVSNTHEALGKVPTIARKHYFATQQALKETQDVYHEFGTMEYYAKQASLLKDYEIMTNRTADEWLSKVQRYLG